MRFRKELNKKSDANSDRKENPNDIIFTNIYKAISEIRYGSIQIHIQDGKIVQIDKINKVRMR